MKFPFNIKDNNHKDWSIFTDKNKSFGTFQFSKHYHKFLITGFSIAVLIISSAFATPLILRKLSGEPVKTSKDQSEKKEEKVVSYAKLSPPPDIEKDQPEDKPEKEPEPEKPEPEEIPKKEPKEQPKPEKTKELTTPEVKKDENVKEESENLASQDEAKAAAKSDAKSESKATKDEKEQKVLDFAEQKPTFPGGRQELLKYIQENIDYPDAARKQGASGQVVVQFVIQPDGRTTNIKVLKDVGYGTAKEAKRIIDSMPKWNAGVQNGRKVPVRMTLPIDFNLDAPSDDL